MLQILAQTPTTLELKVYKDGDLTDLDAVPSLSVVDGDGNTVSTGSVTKPAGTTGIYRATLPGQPDPNVLTATWTGTMSGDAVTFVRRYEIVGDLLFTEAAARSAQVSGGQTPLADTTLYPDAWIADLRSRIVDQFERKTGRSFVRRYCRIRMSGTGRYDLPVVDGDVRLWDGTPLDRPGRRLDIGKVLSVTVSGTAVAASNVVVDGGLLRRTDGLWTRGTSSNPLNVVVEYVYGLPAPTEAAARALEMALANVPGDMSAWTQTFSNDDGSFRFDRTLAYPPSVWEWLKAQTVNLGIA